MSNTAPKGEPVQPPAIVASVVIPHRPKWYQRAVAWLLFFLAKMLLSTIRYRWVNRSGLGETRAPQVIYAIWHNRLALSMKMYFTYSNRVSNGKGLAAMVSASKDGGFLAAILECFGVAPVRGSSSRRGRQALLELTSWAERGYDLAITPDGPRGPKLIVQPGVMSLAQVTGLPILPVSCYLSGKIRTRSWDGFQIPLPFSRCDVVFAKPIVVPREATDETRERLRVELEQCLRSITPD